MDFKHNQAAFSGGEISPMLYGRGEDYERYATAVKNLKNMVCLTTGPATCRPGFRYVDDPKDVTKKARLIPFEFSDSQAYAIEAGDYYMRFYKDGAQILKTLANTTPWYDDNVGIIAWVGGLTDYEIGNVVSQTISAWVTATGYDATDIVRTGTDVYYCHTGHTSGATDEPGVGANWEDYWYFVSEDGNDVRFACKLAHSSGAANEPGVGAAWETYWTLIYDHLESTAYAVGDYVWDPLGSNHPYVCMAAHTSSHEKNIDMPGHGSEWLSLGYFVRADFGEYNVGDMVKVATTIYICTADHTSVAATNKPGSGSSWGSYWSAATVYEIATPYSETEVAALQYAQSADTLFITHPNHHPRKLKRIQHDYWTFYSFACAVFVDESIDQIKTFTARPYINGIAAWNLGFGTSVIDGGLGEGKVVTANFTESDVGKYVVRNGVRPDHAGIFHITHYLGSGEVWGEITESFTPQPAWVTATDYEVGYVVTHGSSDYLCISGHTSGGTTEPGAGGSWEDVWSGPYVEFLDWHFQDDFDRYGGNPAAITFQDDRLFLGATSGGPTDLFASKVGIYNDFTDTETVVDSDGLRLTLLSRKVQVISWLQAHQKLLVGTVEAEWLVSSSTGDGPITALSKQARVGSYHGSLQGRMPAEAENAIIHIQRHGKTIWEVYFNSELDGYIGEDLMVLSSHLTKGTTLLDIAYQKEPHKILWCVRSDGVLLGLTYHHEQKVAGWHRHTYGTAGNSFESIMVLPGETGDDLWAVVKRRTGATSYTREIVKLDPFFNASETVDAFFLDSGLTYDGRQEIESINESTDVVTITDHGYLDDDLIRFRVEDDPLDTVGTSGSLHEKIFAVSDKTDHTFKCKVAVGGAYVDFSTYTKPNITHGTAANNTVAKMITVVSGLSHLEGQTVQVVGDGIDLDDEVVAAGAITISAASSVVHAGLSYVCDLETLPAPVPLRSGTSHGETKNIKGVVILVQDSQGFKVGPNSGGLMTVPVTDEVAPYTEEIPLFSGEKAVSIDDVHETTPTILIRQDAPLPLTVLGLTKQMEID